MLGPLLLARWAGQSIATADGYPVRLSRRSAPATAVLGISPNMWLACLCIVLAHCGGSTVWVFSTTFLQLNTEDRFRGRVFSADLGFSMLTIAMGAYVCGYFLIVECRPEWWRRTTGLHHDSAGIAVGVGDAWVDRPAALVAEPARPRQITTWPVVMPVRVGQSWPP